MNITCNECGKKQSELYTSNRELFTLIRKRGGKQIFYCAKCIEGMLIKPIRKGSYNANQ